MKFKVYQTTNDNGWNTLVNVYPFMTNKSVVVVVGFVALRPKSTAMVIAGRSVHLTTLFPAQP